MNRHERRARAAKDPRLVGADVRYGGRTLELRVYVNTDEAGQAVFERVMQAVKSAPNQPMVVITVAECSVEEAKPLWEKVIAAMHGQVELEQEARDQN